MKRNRLLILLAVGAHWVLPNTAHALTLVEAFGLALNVDAQYKIAQADLEINRNQALQAYFAYAPQLGYQRSQPSFANSSVDTVTFNQPLFDAEKLALMRQSGAREGYAEASFLAREQELAQRLYRAVAQWLLANEALAANDARIRNLQKQAERAKRMFQLGQASITDQRDVTVKFEQARAQHLTLQTQARTAEMQIKALTGVAPRPDDFQLPAAIGQPGALDMDDLLARTFSSNPKLQAARNTETIGRLEALRTRAQFLPAVSLNHTSTWRSAANAEGAAGGRTSYSGISVNLPLDAPRILGSFSASASAAKAMQTRRDAEEQIMLQARQLFETLQSGHELLRIKKSAIEAAQLSVEANTRSAEAGVRSTVDVLNAIDLLFQVRNEYANAVVATGEAMLNLLLVSAHPVADSVRDTELFVFQK